MFRPLENVYQEDGPVYLWLALNPSDPWGNGDCSLKEVQTREVGDTPAWLLTEIQECGIDGIIRYSDWQPDGGSWAYWGLTNGIGPGQPFCVELYPPQYYKSGGYYEPEEWDVEWSWDIVLIRPRVNPAMSWSRYFDAMRRMWARDDNIRERLLKKQRTDVSALYLRWHHWENSVRVTLCSKHTDDYRGKRCVSEVLFEAEDKTGNRDAALKLLWEEVAKTDLGRQVTRWDIVRDGESFQPWPHLRPETFRALPAQSW